MIQILEKHTNALQKILFFAPLAILVSFALANIVMAAHVSDAGARIHVYEEKIARTSAHNDEMLQELASKQSLTSIKLWALAQGFIPHGQLTVIRPSAPKIARVDIQ